MQWKQAHLILSKGGADASIIRIRLSDGDTVAETFMVVDVQPSGKVNISYVEGTADERVNEHVDLDTPPKAVPHLQPETIELLRAILTSSTREEQTQLETKYTITISES